MSEITFRSNKRPLFMIIAVAFIAVFTISVIGIADDSDAAVNDTFQEGGISYQVTSTGPASVKVIGSLSDPYSGDVIIPASVTHDSVEYRVTTIYSSAFYENESVTSISIPSSVTSIDDYALGSCSSLRTLYVHASTVPTIGPNTLHYTYLTSIYVPYLKLDDYSTADNWKEYSAKMLPAVEIPAIKDDLKYDGTEHTVVSAIDGVYTVSGNTGTDAGSYSAALTLAEASPARYWFDGTQSEQHLEWNIAKRSIVMTSASASKVYDGKPLTNDSVTVTGDGFVAGQSATYYVTGTQTDVGSSDNVFEYELTGASDDNYDIDVVYGKLTVTAATPVITIIKSSSCPSGNYNVGASATSGALLSYTILAGSDIISIDQNGKVTAKNVGSAKIKVSCGETDNYAAAEKEFDITVYDHIHVIVPGTAPTKTTSGITEGEECSECHKVFKEGETIPATGSEKSVIGSKDTGVKYAVPKSDDLKELKVALDGSGSSIELNEESTNKVKGTLIEFSIKESEDKKGTFSAVMKSDDKEFNGLMNVTLPYDPSKGSPSVKWVEGNERMDIVSVNEAEKTITFMTTHNSTYAVEYENNAVSGSIIGIVLIAAVIVLSLFACAMYVRKH